MFDPVSIKPGLIKKVLERKMSMAGTERHVFPGNNTPEGFFSYYRYILSQREAERIIVIKGGPGVGKSTFMKKIGEEMLQDGHDVDYMHCSSDNDSLDGVVIRDQRIALIDGTAPHIVDPVNPGAVDSIIHLGDYWNEEGIRKDRDALISCNEKIGSIFGHAYNYLAAAGKMHDNMSSIFDTAIDHAALYKLTAKVIVDELAKYDIGSQSGGIRKYFASAITPDGIRNYLDTLIQGYSKIYLIKAPIGTGAERMLELFMESAVFRGFLTEGYYCPMKPASKLEHLLIPELGLAFVTSNQYHTITLPVKDAEIVTIDLERILNADVIRSKADILDGSAKKMEELIGMAVECLARAKQEHDGLEKYYIPNMDFMGIDKLRLELTNKLKSAVPPVPQKAAAQR
jgi:hypothetical protein